MANLSKFGRETISAIFGRDRQTEIGLVFVGMTDAVKDVMEGLISTKLQLCFL